MLTFPYRWAYLMALVAAVSMAALASGGPVLAQQQEVAPAPATAGITRQMASVPVASVPVATVQAASIPVVTQTIASVPTLATAVIPAQVVAAPVTSTLLAATPIVAAPATTTMICGTVASTPVITTAMVTTPVFATTTQQTVLSPVQTTVAPVAPAAQIQTALELTSFTSDLPPNSDGRVFTHPSFPGRNLYWNVTYQRWCYQDGRSLTGWFFAPRDLVMPPPL